MFGAIRKVFDKNRHEADPGKPIELPVGYKAPPTLHERVRALMSAEFARAAQENGHETFEESDDFDIEDDPKLQSPWELPEDNLLSEDIAAFRAAKGKTANPSGAKAAEGGAAAGGGQGAPEGSPAQTTVPKT